MTEDQYSDSDVIDFLKKIGIKSIGVSEKAVEALNKENINTLYDLCETDLLKFRGGIPGLGQVRQREVQNIMTELGLRFKWTGHSPYDSLFSESWKQKCNTKYSEVDVSKILDLLMKNESPN